MEDRLRRDMWWGLALKGLLATAFGVVAVFWPELTLTTLVYLFGGFILATGLVGLVTALASLNNVGGSLLSRLLTLLLGVGEIGVGVYLLQHPDVSFATFIIIAGVVLVVRGLLDLFAGIFEPGNTLTKTVLVVGGLVAGVAGVLLMFQAEENGVSFVWILGLYALLVGPMLLASAYEARNLPVTVARTVRKRA